MAGDFLQYCRPAWRQPWVTLPPFAAFWQANRLLEMPENPANAQFVRFADFRRDPDNHPLKRPAAKSKSILRALPAMVMRIVPVIRCGWRRMSGTGTPMRGRFSYFPRIRRTVCIASLTTVRYGSGMRWPDANR